MKNITNENINNFKIFEFNTGSVLYGTNTITSDIDISGVFIAPKRYYLGLDKIEQFNLSKISKNDFNKNNSDAIDYTLYEIKKIVQLMALGSPNAIETVFINKENIIYIDQFGQRLLDNYALFPSKLVKQRFLGYSISQMHKAKVKPDNFKDLQGFKAVYDTSPIKSFVLVELKHYTGPWNNYITFYADHASIGGLNFNLNTKMTKVYDAVIARLAKASHRQDMWTKFGADMKFLSHCVRLILEGKELLETGKIVFPLKDKDLLLDIRNGKYKLEEIHELVEDKKNELENFEGDLPAEPNFDKINKFLIETVEDFWNYGKRN